jgi:DNA-binding XRE family transcriptional regulator
MLSAKSKYYPLFEYLSGQPDTASIALTFEEVEAILGNRLPETARSVRAWWLNKTAQGRAWQEAGWLVERVDFTAGTVVFRPARLTYRQSAGYKSRGWSAAEIKALRDFAGWSQQELAETLGVRQQTVSDWELGIHTSRRSMGKLLQMVAEQVGYPYQTARESKKKKIDP